MPRKAEYNFTLNRDEWIAFHSFCNYRTVINLGDIYVWSHNAESANSDVIKSLVEKKLVEPVKPTKYATIHVVLGLASHLRPKKRP